MHAYLIRSSVGVTVVDKTPGNSVGRITAISQRSTATTLKPGLAV